MRNEIPLAGPRASATAARIALALLAAAPAAHAEVYRCQVGGSIVYQQLPCDRDAAKASTLKLDDAVAPATPAATAPQPAAARPAVMPPGAAAAPAPPPRAPAPRKTETEILADRCLDWYRPLLRDPRSAYWRDANYAKRVLTFVIYATQGFGGYTSKQASCEFRNGRIDESWTRIQAQRLGWPV